MDLSILIGLIIFLTIVALGLVFFIKSGLNFEDANTVDNVPPDENYDYKREL